jgi:hypothetical protein
LAVGLTARETHATVKSGLRAGARWPRSPDTSARSADRRGAALRPIDGPG